MSYILKKSLQILLLSIAVFTCPNTVFAQQKYALEYEKQGDKAMTQGNYLQALEYYKTGRKFLKQNLTLMYKCGQACLAMQDYDKAEYWYQKVLIENDTADINSLYPDLYLNLAKSAIANGNIIQAQSFLNTCLMDCNDIEIRKECKNLLSKIDWIIDNDNPLEYNIVNLGKNINDPTSQFNTFLIRDSVLIFTTPEYNTKEIDGQTYYTDVYNQIYYSYIDEDYYTPAKKLEWGKINKKKTDCADLFLDTVTATAYFTYAKTKNGVKTTDIYFSKFDPKKNKWSKPEIFKPVYDKDASDSHPVITRKGNECIMYFASDRKGGFGCMDLWYYDMNDINSLPKNLGANINTKGNEITPFYDTENDELYFSSDTHLGFGGFDIFRAKGNKSSFSHPENLMLPINSPANDIYPYIKKSENEGYFTSNRPTVSNKDNKTCCNDIYRFNKKETKPVIEKPKYTEPPKPKFDIEKQLPVALYFHNDSPDAGSENPVTELSYYDCFKLYVSLSNQYKVNRTKGLDDSLATVQLADIDNFFDNKVKKGYQTLNDAMHYILEQLQKGKNITVQIRGYCSSLFDTQYNHTLAERRIVSVENFMKQWNNGVLKPYMETLADDGQMKLATEHLAVGKLESTSPNPQSLEEKRKSVYLTQAMEERRIEIKVIKVRE